MRAFARIGLWLVDKTASLRAATESNVSNTQGLTQHTYNSHPACVCVCGVAVLEPLLQQVLRRRVSKKPRTTLGLPAHTPS